MSVKSFKTNYWSRTERCVDQRPLDDQLASNSLAKCLYRSLLHHSLIFTSIMFSFTKIKETLFFCYVSVYWRKIWILSGKNKQLSHINLLRHVLPVPARVLSGYFSFLPQSENMQTGGSVNGHSKLPIGVNNSMDGCLNLYVSPVMNWWLVQGVPLHWPQDSEIGSSPPPHDPWQNKQ